MAHDTIAVELVEPDLAVVALAGEHEAFGAPKLELQLAALLAEDYAVVVDLTEATFLDSATLFVLLRAHTKAAERRLGFALQMGDDAGKYVRRAFELTRLSSVFAIGTSRDEAIAAALRATEREPRGDGTPSA
jgi:anti-sigma B factor antagonist